MSSKEKLKKLEQEGRWLFHGSPYKDVQIIEPKQATHIPDLSKSEEVVSEGNPAVSATPYVDFAIFRAVINRVNIPIEFVSGFGFRDNKKEFHVSKKEVLEIAKSKTGFVYVFDRKDFEPYQRGSGVNLTKMEWRAYKKVEPVEVVSVGFEDLPEGDPIQIF